MKTVDTINFAGKRALVRVDFNVPLDKTTFAITDDARIRATIPTLKKILADGGSCVLMSHLGRPLKKLKEDGTVDFEKHTLKHTLSCLSQLLGVDVQFANDCIGQEATDKAAALQPGQVLLLENLRFYKEEEKGEVTFAEKLSKLGDVYVNDAFGTAHRAHASTAVIAQFFPTAKCFGYVMAKEVANAEMVMKQAARPFTAITGGAKVSDKLLILENLIDKVDNLIIGGGMAYTFLKAMGFEIGSSLCEEDRLQLCLDLMAKAKAKGVNINDIYNTINATFGSFYVNDFSLYGRTYKVNMQAIDTYRSNAEDMQYIYVKSSNGELLPLDSFVTLKQIVGADIIERFNLFQAAKVSGQPAAGYSSGDALKAIEEVSKEVLPQGYTISWVETAYQEKQIGGSSAQAFIFGIIF